MRGVALEHATDLDTLSDQLRSALRTLNRTAVTVEHTAARLDSAATSDEVKNLLANFVIASTEMRHAATQVHELSLKLVTTQQHADAFLASGDSVLSKMNSGQGTLGLLLNDPSMYRRTDSLLVELRALTADIRANPKKYVNVRIF